MNLRLARINTAAALAVFTLGIGAPNAAASAAGEDLRNDEVLVGVEVQGKELEEDLPVPGEPEDEADLPDVEPRRTECKPGWFFKITKNKKNTMSVKYSTFVENKTSRALDFKFTPKKSGTTEVGGSVTLSTEMKVTVLGSIKGEINANAKKSWTSEIGVETYGKVPAKSIVYGDFGILKEKVYEYKYHRGSACQKSNKRYMTVWAPYKEGWRVS
ncbi:hypothetical protein ACF052_32445 [Streptomyces pilosus]|uniref:hypothetical protein n=1 Tax=Streptomyces pilosus TaxID=28893 RepID=UPI0036FAA7D2